MVEALKADGRPDVVTRMNAIELVVGSVAMLVLLPFGLVGVCIGISIGAVVRAAYAFGRAHAVVGLPRRSLLEAIRAPSLAGLVMVAILLPLETFVVHAGDHATVTGLLLLALEAALGLAVYTGILHVLVPGALAEFRALIRKIWTRSRPGDELSEQQRRAVGDLATASAGLGRAAPRTGQS